MVLVWVSIIETAANLASAENVVKNEFCILEDDEYSISNTKLYYEWLHYLKVKAMRTNGLCVLLYLECKKLAFSVYFGYLILVYFQVDFKVFVIEVDVRWPMDNIDLMKNSSISVEQVKELGRAERF